MSLPNTSCLTDQQIARLLSTKIFFGHQSVGNNIVAGIKDLAREDARLTLRIVKSADPQSIACPALVEFDIGQNGSPESKIAAFRQILEKGAGFPGGVAILKFCYVDITPSTDVYRMAELYDHAIAVLKEKNPSLKVVHVTVPLTTTGPRFKQLIKRLLGRGTRQELNSKREQFNEIIRRKYAGIDAIFDLAELESTHPDGSRSYITFRGKKIYTLAAEFTADGGHLNELGRRLAARRLLSAIAESTAGADNPRPCRNTLATLPLC